MARVLQFPAAHGADSHRLSRKTPSLLQPIIWPYKSGIVLSARLLFINVHSLGIIVEQKNWLKQRGYSGLTGISPLPRHRTQRAIFTALGAKQKISIGWRPMDVGIGVPGAHYAPSKASVYEVAVQFGDRLIDSPM